ncbi:MAG: hypothetical protein RR053_04675 [Evtepia sp.]
MSVFSKNLNPLSGNTAESLRELQDYIIYMQEQVEFHVSALKRQNQNTRITDLEKQVSALSTRVKALEAIK